MSIFVPFKAFRPTQENAKSVASKPYDVLNAKEAKLEAEGNPVSFYNVIKPEINFPEDSNFYAPEVYLKGKEKFDNLVSQNIIKQDGVIGFATRGLATKILSNGIQSATFTVLWKYLEGLNKDTNNIVNVQQ